MAGTEKLDSTPSALARSVDGRLIVIIVVGLAVVLALVGLKFRQPSPMQREGAQPATLPATTVPATQPTASTDLPSAASDDRSLACMLRSL